MTLSGAIFELLKTFAGFFILLAAWFGFQAILRRRSHCGGEKDMLQFMLGGCGSCANRGTCETKKRKDPANL